MKPRYKVDLAQQLAICEANYLLLQKLTPGLEGCEQWNFAVSIGQHCLKIRIAVAERNKYTTTMEVIQQGLSHWTQPPKLSVRLYHDAQMAEVVAWEKHRYVKPRYDYPNQCMYHRDEKAQMNIFLGEWLSHCLQQGHVIEDLVTLGLVG